MKLNINFLKKKKVLPSIKEIELETIKLINNLDVKSYGGKLKPKYADLFFETENNKKFAIIIREEFSLSPNLYFQKLKDKTGATLIYLSPNKFRSSVIETAPNGSLFFEINTFDWKPLNTDSKSFNIFEQKIYTFVN